MTHPTTTFLEWLDRINNKYGYTLENVISCCKFCNYAKRNSSKDEYVKRCKIVASRF